MFSAVFSQNSLLWRILNTITDLFVLSIMWLVCSLPILTLGSATTALYDSVVRCVRYKQPGPYRRFWQCFKTELRVTVPTTLLWGLVIAVLVFWTRFFVAQSEEIVTAKAFATAYDIILLIPVGIFCWSCPIQSRFSNGFMSLNLTAIKFCFAKLPRTLVISLLAVELLQLSIKYFFSFFFTPALTMLLWSLFTEPVFTKLGGGLKKEDAKPEEEQ